MKVVLHLISGLGSGGAERMLCRIACHGSDGPGTRHVVCCITDEGFHINGSELERAGVTVHCLHLNRWWQLPAAAVRLGWLLRQVRPDVFMTWLYHADLLGTLVAPLAGVKALVWNLRCSELDFAHHSRLTRLEIALLAMLSGRPLGIAANSRAGENAHRRAGYRARRWWYLPNGIEPQRWRPDAADRQAVRLELGLQPDETAVVMVARVDAMKDHAGLLAAVRRLASLPGRARFVLIGRGTQQLTIPKDLTATVVALGERLDVPRLLRGFDLAVLSSAYGEGFPNVLAEAMATGLPCIATDVGDAAEVVGEGGFIVPKRDPTALADAIARFLSMDSRGRAQLAGRALARASTRWTIDRAAEAYETLWKDVAS